MRDLHDLQRDEEGTLLVFFALALAVLLGMIALSFDLGRVANTQTELQSFADSVALAAAAELDGKADAITRAQSAATNLITDRQTFAQDGQALDIADVTLTFLSSLPANDSNIDPVANIICTGVACASATATQAGNAAFVRAGITPHVVQMGFASALSVLTGGQPNDAQVAATATAGFTQVACAVTPLMFCLPEPGYTADANIGDMIVLRSSRQNAPWQPGNFGFLDPTSTAVPDPNGPCGGRLNGRELYSCLVGAAGPVVQCYSMRGVDTQPGQRVGIAEAFNARFDIFDATMGQERNNPDYAPAPNTIKGFANVRQGGGNGQCNVATGTGTAASIPLPRDTCLANNTCPGTQVGGESRFGNGVWNRDGYILANHDGVDPQTSASNPRTRYQMYLDEIALAGARNLPATKLETGAAQCHATPTADPNRRVLIAAGIDCTTTTFNGSATNIPVEEFFKLFMTEPAQKRASGSPPDIDIVAEIIGSAGSAGSTTAGIFRDVVQLYR